MLSELERWSGVLDEGVRRTSYARYLSSWEDRIGAFLELKPDSRLPPADDGKTARGDESLSAVPFAVKDNIAVKGFGLTCGSKILEGFRSPYSATCVDRLLKKGAVVVGKTNLDEFGMGSSTDNSAYKRTSNPWDTTRVAGGSSGGSAAAVAAGMVPFALGTDTGGSVRQPASFCGVYGLKPTYGAISRYGLTAYASSLETPGILAASLNVVEAVFGAAHGVDPMDQTSLEPDAETLSRAEAAQPRKVAVLRGLSGLDPEIASAYARTAEKLSALGLEVVEVDMPTLEYVVPSYYVIATAEASANLARFTGIGYGRRSSSAETPDELVRASRSEGFGEEVKLRILLGTYVLRSGFQSRYYLKAQRVRTAIRNDFTRIFGTASLLMMPVFPVKAFPHGDAGMDAFQQKLADRFTCAANLAGVPALAFPAGTAGGLPVGLQFMAPAFHESLLFRAARLAAGIFPVEHPAGYSEEFLS
jgi:aspartyl-tRNA(Asn)/glutamyl-tRNA(Gln) amidotransferase subunit A